MGKTTYPPGATFCRHCGYCLFGLPTSICPECGHGFDPADPATFLARPRRRGLRRAIFWGVVGVLVLCLAYGGFLTWLYVGWRAEAGARALPTGPQDHLKTRSILPAALSHLLMGDCRQWQERVDELEIWSRSFRSSGIHSIAACRQLRKLLLAGMPLRIDDVAALCQCQELEELRLYACDLYRGDLAPIRRLVRLKSLSVYANQALGDDDLAIIAKLEGLGSLSVSCTTITDEGLAQLSELNHLRALDLSYCLKLTDAAVPSLSRVSGLKELSLSGTHLTRAGIDQIKKNLPGCRATGP